MTALRTAHHRVRNVERKSDLITLMTGLAKVAASSRNTRLADELRILIRSYDGDCVYRLSIGEKLPDSVDGSGKPRGFSRVDEIRRRMRDGVRLW